MTEIVCNGVKVTASETGEEWRRMELFCLRLRCPRRQHILLHHHQLLEVYASATRISSAGGGVIPFYCTIYFLSSLVAVPRLECIPLRSTSSALPPVLP